MRGFETLGARLDETARARVALAPACQVIASLAEVGAEISAIVSLGALAGSPSETGGAKVDGYAQRELELRIHDMITATLRDAPVASILSEELGDWMPIDLDHPLNVAFEPLDGSSHLDANLAAGTIFSILPSDRVSEALDDCGAHMAAGFFLYGPRTTLVLTCGDGVDVYTFDRRDRTWRLTHARAIIPAGTPEYAINASNGRWNEFVRAVADDYPNSVAEPRAEHDAKRWVGALADEAFRILVRGGVYLHPSDQRAAYRGGWPRLICEAHPIAFIMEQAGGKASTGRARILDVSASHPHVRAPLIFGCAEQVAFIERLLAAPPLRGEVSPLFGRRGLFRN
jgi:fructose-1,6-bisphosphatase I